MSRVRTYLLVVIASGVAEMIGAAFGTGTAQAVVSTLVGVVNPTTSPVPSLNVTDPGRIPYQASISNAACASINDCTLVFPPVPTGHRVVVQHISGVDGLGRSATSVWVSFYASANPAGPKVSSFFAPQIVGGGLYAYDQPVLAYVDSGNSPTVEPVTNGDFQGEQYTTLTGYELDCTVAACAPIASQ